MKTTIFEAVKTSKGGILKKALIIGGAIVGLAIVTKLVKSRNSDLAEVTVDEDQPVSEESVEE
jgi:hypothetical protein